MLCNMLKNTDVESNKFNLMRLLVIFVLFVVVAIPSFFLLKTKQTPAPEAEIVTSFPQAPIYPDSRLLESSEKSNEDSFKFEATWETNDAVPVVSKWYVQNAESDGWILDVLPSDPENVNVQTVVLRKEKMILNISLLYDSGTKSTKIVYQIRDLPTVTAGPKKE